MSPKFYGSMTSLSAGELRQLLALQTQLPHRALFQGVITSPLFARRSTLDLIRDRATDWEIIFDSGGYYVQQGLISYSELSKALYKCYLTHRWAHHVVLPDCVPTSLDDDRTVNAKVNVTITGSLRFLNRLPDVLREKAIPVIQGRTRAQASRCIDAYLRAGCTLLAFGSFGTTGRRQGMNRLTREALDTFHFAVTRSRQDHFRLHALGIGNPPTIAILRSLGVYSFDTSSWIRTAGHGNIYFPYSSEHHITGNASNRRSLSLRRFYQVKALTHHSCFFCRDFAKLRTLRLYRALHNLSVLTDAVHNPYDINKLLEFAPRYFRLVDDLLREEQNGQNGCVPHRKGLAQRS